MRVSLLGAKNICFLNRKHPSTALFSSDFFRSSNLLRTSVYEKQEGSVSGECGCMSVVKCCGGRGGKELIVYPLTVRFLLCFDLI